MAVLWYFAYGSNMCAATFVERRGIRPLDARRARLDAHRLCFNLAVGPGERAVANVEPDVGACTWGVAYLISAEQAEHLDRTEGVHGGAYTRAAVTVELASAERLTAFTYRSTRTCEGRKPSARYMRLLLAGAREHDLPVEYVRALEALELAWDERLAGPRRDGA